MALPITAAVVDDYIAVAAGQTDSVLERVTGSGAIGDILNGILIIPSATNCGVVSIKDGSTALGNVFDGGGTTALVTLVPFYVPFGARSKVGAWSVTTGANVKVRCFGNFS